MHFGNAHESPLAVLIKHYWEFFVTCTFYISGRCGIHRSAVKERDTTCLTWLESVRRQGYHPRDGLVAFRSTVQMSTIIHQKLLVSTSHRTFVVLLPPVTFPVSSKDCIEIKESVWHCKVQTPNQLHSQLWMCTAGRQLPALPFICSTSSQLNMPAFGALVLAPPVTGWSFYANRCKQKSVLVPDSSFPSFHVPLLARVLLIHKRWHNVVLTLLQLWACTAGHSLSSFSFFSPNCDRTVFFHTPASNAFHRKYIHARCSVSTVSSQYCFVSFHTVIKLLIEMNLNTSQELRWDSPDQKNWK